MNIGEVHVAAIVAEVDGRRTRCGEVYLYGDGTAAVYDDLWGDPTRYCDTWGQAMRVIVTRIVMECELVW